MNKIPAEFTHFLNAPVISKDNMLVEKYIQQLYTERVENIYNNKKEASDADLMLVLADLSLEAPLNTEYTEIFEYLGYKEAKNKVKQLSSGAKEEYSHAKKELFRKLVKAGKENPSSNFYVFAGRTVLDLPNDLIKEAGIPVLMSLVTKILIILRLQDVNNDILPKDIIDYLKSEFRDVKFSLYDTVDAILNSMQDCALEYIKEHTENLDK
jgi:hypothetical protein